MAGPKIIETALAREQANFDRHLGQLSKLGGQTAEKVLWKYSSRFVAQLVRRTQPAKAASKALDVGRKAVDRDLSRIYILPSRVYPELQRQSRESAEAWYWAVKNGHGELASNIAASMGLHNIAQITVGPFDGGRRHRETRRRGGRRKAQVDSRQQLLISGNPKSVRDYAEQVQKRVGLTKAQWLIGFNPPGGIRGVPKWVKEQERRATSGRFQVERKGNGAVRLLVFLNDTPWIQHVFRPRDAQGALNLVARAMGREVVKQLGDNPRKVR